ncbi:hypothetical protein Tco_1116394 [Tanacetum coccineum]
MDMTQISLEDEFPGTDNDTTDNDSFDEDTIQESQSPNCEGKYLPVCKKHNPKVKSHKPIRGCVLGLTNVQTWDDIYMKFGVRKVESGAAKAKGKGKVRDASVYLSFQHLFDFVLGFWIDFVKFSASVYLITYCVMFLRVRYLSMDLNVILLMWQTKR